LASLILESYFDTHCGYSLVYFPTNPPVILGCS